MDRLPVEILTKIIDFLTPREQVQLQLVSRRFFELSRDNHLWRLHCYEDSRNGRQDAFRARNPTVSHLRASTTPLSLRSLGPGSLRTLINPTTPASSDAYGDEFPEPSIGQRSRAAAEWDPSYENEHIDWYSEYIARNAPLSFSWLKRPPRGFDKLLSRHVKGMGLFRDWSFARDDRVVAPLEDGTVCLWDLNHSHSSSSRLTKGNVCGTSQPGILFADRSKRSEKSPPRGPPLEFLGVGECMSVDSVRKRAYICVANVLNEVDLETLRVVHQERYAWSIFALSQETDYSVPITLATTLSLQIYDARLSRPDEEAELSIRCEKPADLSPDSNLYSHPDSQILRLLPNGQPPQRIRSPEPNERGANYAPLFQPGPLSILHPPTPHVNTILLAGRFPSILCYDRRTFPKLQQPIHSGGRLCGLASILPPRFPVSSDTGWPRKHTIVACGDYNGRGSLELHDLVFNGSDPQDKDAESTMHTARYQNRQSASSSKLLSVASHGARIVFSDANGNIKWVERDGRTEVRRWNINTDRPHPHSTAPDDNSVDGLISPSGVFLRSETSSRNAVARKILPTDANLDGDELLLWTGERIGRLRFSSGGHDDADEEDDDGDGDDMDEDGDDGVLADGADLSPAQRQAHRNSRQAQRHREKEYAHMMRLALERQADEVRWMGRLGMA